MFSDEDVGHVAGLIPARFAGHVVGDERAVDGEVFEAEVFHTARLVIAGDDAYAWLPPAVVDVAEGDVADAAARPVAVFSVEAHAEVEEHALADALDVEILKGEAVDEDVVAVVDADAALIVNLVLSVFEDVDAVVDDVGNLFGLRSLAVKADHDGVGHVGPKDAVADADVAATSTVVLARAVDGGAVVAGACEEVVLPDVVAGEDVESVAPAVPAHHFGIAYGDRVAAADGHLRGEGTVDEYATAVAHHDAFVAARHDEAVAEDAHIVGTIDRQPSVDDGSWIDIDGLARGYGDAVTMEVVVAGAEIDEVAPADLGLVHDAVSEDVEVVVDTAIDFHRQIAWAVECEAQCVAIACSPDAIGERADAETVDGLGKARHLQLHGAGEFESGYGDFAHVVACAGHLVDAHQIGVNWLPWPAADACRHGKIVFQSHTLRGGSYAQLIFGLQGEQAEQQDCDEQHLSHKGWLLGWVGWVVFTHSFL